MIKLGFEYREDGFRPIHGDIDWRERSDRLIAEKLRNNPNGRYLGEPWAVVVEEDGQVTFQVTQQNCLIELNHVAPEMDRLSLVDPRDNEPWVIYRSELVEDETDEEMMTFDSMLKWVSSAAMTVETWYPSPTAVELWLGRMATKLAQDESEFEHGA